VSVCQQHARPAKGRPRLQTSRFLNIKKEIFSKKARADENFLSLFFFIFEE